MTAEEADRFERSGLFELSIRIRKWDQLAKEIDRALVDLEDLKARAKRVLAGGGPIS